jgi:uncharacterized protein
MGLEPWVVLLAVLLMSIGMVGVIVPMLPGLLLVWIATAGSLLLQGTDAVGWSVVALLTVFLLAGTAATIVLPARQGMQSGTARSSFGYAALGAFVGFFVVPVLGLVIGGLAGLLWGERQQRGGWEPALASTGRVLRAYGVGLLVELGLGLTMIVTWAVTLLLRS